MKEIWKTYRDTKYTPTGKVSKIAKIEVSNLGRVKKNGIILEDNDFKNIRGYYVFNCNGHIRVHRAVAELFIPNLDNKPCIDHIDTDIHNNRVDNLRWVTYKENRNNPLTINNYKESFKGEKNPMFGRHHSEETKQKQSMKMLEYYKNHPERREEISNEHKGNKNFLGRHHSEEAKQKMSDTRKKYYINQYDIQRVKQIQDVCI